EELVDVLAEQLATNFYQTTQLLGTIVTFIEYYYDGSHSRFVSDKSAELAALLDMSEEAVTEVRFAGLLHDIGKLGMKDNVLFKYPNEMSDSEYKQYTMHPIVGRQILIKHDGFKNIAEIVYQHHEKLDGSGFPNHLTAKDIHPGAAIIGVVDYYHNSMFKRKKRRTNQTGSTYSYSSTGSFLESTSDRYSATMNYLNQKAGVLYDRKVVQSFIGMMESERRIIGRKTVMRVPVNKLEPGMVFAEDYFTSFGLLIAARGEAIGPEMVRALVRFAESGEIPHKILVVK
ncbi:MAG: HD-GYP domain-containing protein, partial [Bacteroidota bacterium]